MLSLVSFSVEPTHVVLGEFYTSVVLEKEDGLGGHLEGRGHGCDDIPRWSNVHKQSAHVLIIDELMKC